MYISASAHRVVRSFRTEVIARCELPDVGAGNGIELGSYVTAEDALDC